jgi:CRISPR-associated endonuclease Cas1
MASEDLPWVAVTGFGAHIKATPIRLVIQQKGRVSEIPLRRIPLLLIIGGHTLHSSVITTLVKNSIPVLFFEADGTPVGVIRPYGDTRDERMRLLQANAPKHRFAVTLARGSLQSRILAIQKLEEESGSALLYEGELAFLHKANEELEYLIRLEEIRRLSRLTSDMYYEVLARSLPRELNFRRRSAKPSQDPVNAMLSLGYAMLYGSGMVSILGSRLDPDLGLLHEGPGSLVHDLIDPFKAGMVDKPVLSLAARGIPESGFEMSAERCLLADDLVMQVQGQIKTTIDTAKITEQVQILCGALCNGGVFTIRY